MYVIGYKHCVVYKKVADPFCFVKYVLEIYFALLFLLSRNDNLRIVVFCIFAWGKSEGFLFAIKIFSSCLFFVKYGVIILVH